MIPDLGRQPGPVPYAKVGDRQSLISTAMVGEWRPVIHRSDGHSYACSDTKDSANAVTFANFTYKFSFFDRLIFALLVRERCLPSLQAALGNSHLLNLE